MHFIIFVFIAVMFAACVQAGTTVPAGLQGNLSSSNCGGNCPGGCSSCPCGTSTNYQDINSWCSKYSWNQAHCQCIMKHESGGNANAVNQNSGGSFDVGLWQVNSGNWASCSGGSAPCGTSTNLECAKAVYNWGGKTWKFWSTCTTCGACSSA
eukprot:Colp12_sorted_trinity150504_noHs@11832